LYVTQQLTVASKNPFWNAGQPIPSGRRRVVSVGGEEAV